jgi:hypothetical protein
MQAANYYQDKLQKITQKIDVVVDFAEETFVSNAD